MHRASPPVRSADRAPVDSSPRTGEQEHAAALRRPSMKSLALRLLARREHSRRELERKLLRHAATGGAGRTDGPSDFAREDVALLAHREIQSALDDLAARGLLSDARVAESVVVAKSGRFGGRRLQQALQAKGLAPELIEQALQQARPGELERAREVWRRRFGAVATSPGERARQARFLAGRGFAADIIYRVIQGPDETD